MGRIVIDASDCIVGRLATQAAKLAKLGHEVIIVNCEEAVISGRRSSILKDLVIKLERGTTEKGPFLPKRPDRMVRRIIRGMMDYKGTTGKPAFNRIKTFVGTPEEYKAHISNDFMCKKSGDLEANKYVKMSDVCKEIGGKW